MFHRTYSRSKLGILKSPHTSRPFVFWYRTLQPVAQVGGNGGREHATCGHAHALAPLQADCVHAAWRSAAHLPSLALATRTQMGSWSTIVCRSCCCAASSSCTAWCATPDTPPSRRVCIVTTTGVSKPSGDVGPAATGSGNAAAVVAAGGDDGGPQSPLYCPPLQASVAAVGGNTTTAAGTPADCMAAARAGEHAATAAAVAAPSHGVVLAAAPASAAPRGWQSDGATSLTLPSAATSKVHRMSAPLESSPTSPSSIAAAARVASRCNWRAFAAPAPGATCWRVSKSSSGGGKCR